MSSLLVLFSGLLLLSSLGSLPASSSHSVQQVAVSRALNGIGLAIVTPAIQSLVADSTDDHNRGTAFGWLQLTSNVGAIVGGLCSIIIAPITVMGVAGWRIAFYLVAVLSIVVGVLVYLFAKDPRFAESKLGGTLYPNKSFCSEVKDLAREAKSVMKISSFQIIVAQGVTGTFPWSALTFAPMWLELVGFSHGQTAFLVALFIASSSIGSLFGGKMGDFLSIRLPNSGRIILAQISSVLAIPLSALLLLVLPSDPSTVASHGFVLVVMGFCISWNAPATNNPIFAEIVPEKSRTSVYALDRAFESILSSFAPPLVGILAQQVYGYKPLRHEAAADRENALSLAKALYAAVGVPMALCCLIYSFLYGTYPRDRERAQMEALIESEMQQLAVESSTMDDITNSHVQRDEEPPSIRDRTVIEMEYVGDDTLYLDDHDEKTLLYRQLTFADLGK